MVKVKDLMRTVGIGGVALGCVALCDAGVRERASGIIETITSNGPTLWPVYGFVAVSGAVVVIAASGWLGTMNRIKKQSHIPLSPLAADLVALLADPDLWRNDDPNCVENKATRLSVNRWGQVWTPDAKQWVGLSPPADTDAVAASCRSCLIVLEDRRQAVRLAAIQARVDEAVESPKPQI